MDVKEVEVLQRYLKRHKAVLYVIVGFLALLTYLLVVVAGQVSREQAFQGQSKAFDGGLTTNNGDDQGEGQFSNSEVTMDGDTTSPRSCIAKLAHGTTPAPGNGMCAIESNPRKYSELCFSCPGEPEGSCDHTVRASEIKSTNDSGIICRIDPQTRQRICYKQCATLEELQAKANEKCQSLQACPRDVDPVVPGAGVDPTATPPIPSPTVPAGPSPTPGACKAKLAHGTTPAPGNGMCAIESNPRKYSELCFSCPGEPENSCNHTVSASEIKSTNGGGKCYIDQYTRKKVCYKQCATLEELQARADEKCRSMRACPR